MIKLTYWELKIKPNWATHCSRYGTCDEGILLFESKDYYQWCDGWELLDRETNTKLSNCAELIG